MNEGMPSGALGGDRLAYGCTLQLPRLGSPPIGSQMVPPVAEPVQLGVPPLAVEQKDEQVPAEPTMRQVLPLAQSLAWVQVSPGWLDPVGAQIAPVWST